jgi:hypothetical protein
MIVLLGYQLFKVREIRNLYLILVLDLLQIRFLIGQNPGVSFEIRPFWPHPNQPHFLAQKLSFLSSVGEGTQLRPEYG